MREEEQMGENARANPNIIKQKQTGTPRNEPQNNQLEQRIF